MPNAATFRRQAAIFDRVADQCTIPELVAHYRRLAQDYAAQAAAASEERERTSDVESG